MPRDMHLPYSQKNKSQTWSRESLSGCSIATQTSKMTLQDKSSMLKHLNDPLDFHPHFGEIVWVRDRHVWKMGIVSSDEIEYRLPHEFAPNYSVAAYDAIMLDMRSESEEWTYSRFVPIFGEVKPQDEYVTSMLIDVGILPEDWDYQDKKVARYMEKMKEKLAGRFKLGV
ncbi:hypothetical protein SCHPADRAFT_895102 [Schizopora paradoxa]|uniref:Uncharacterized protein n=1 Tax=Schizopora paradoxa TaxID=27342 RepID=A0A0H2R673_9AGAM|nr:hypothetical protein SCHPADRAFT_895102 [Schizopora paradoxa]